MPKRAPGNRAWHSGGGSKGMSGMVNVTVASPMPVWGVWWGGPAHPPKTTATGMEWGRCGVVWGLSQSCNVLALHARGQRERSSANGNTSTMPEVQVDRLWHTPPVNAVAMKRLTPPHTAARRRVRCRVATLR